MLAGRRSGKYVYVWQCVSVCFACIMHGACDEGKGEMGTSKCRIRGQLFIDFVAALSATGRIASQDLFVKRHPRFGHPVHKRL